MMDGVKLSRWEVAVSRFGVFVDFDVHGINFHKLYAANWRWCQAVLKRDSCLLFFIFNIVDVSCRWAWLVGLLPRVVDGLNYSVFYLENDSPRICVLIVVTWWKLVCVKSGTISHSSTVVQSIVSRSNSRVVLLLLPLCLRFLLLCPCLKYCPGSASPFSSSFYHFFFRVSLVKGLRFPFEENLRAMPEVVALCRHMHHIAA